MKKSTLMLLSVTVLVVIVAATIFFMQGGEQTSGSAEAGQEPLYWVAPMDSNFRRDEPGLSPMGMELVPVYEESGADNTIQVSSAILQNLGLRTARVERMDLFREIEIVGYTRWDESGIQMLHPRAEGWLEVFNLASVGDQVSEGQVIYELFAPNLVSAQQEYLNAREADNPTLAAVARDRLRSLGFSEAQIDSLDDSTQVSDRLVYRAESDTIVTDIGVRRGNYVTPATNIATLVSVDTIWVDVEVFENDAGVVAPGHEATLNFPAFPGESWTSQVAYVYPELNPDTRTLRLRLVIDNSDRRLKANMFANASIKAAPREGALTVPREAVIRSGDGERVLVAAGEGKFQPRVVTTGISSGGMTEVLSGLEEGEMVVSSGQFLLDAEANGEQAFARLTDETDEAEEGMDMEVDMEVTVAGSYTTTGSITRKGPDDSLTLAHEPVPELDWPSMTMGFEVAPEVPVEDFSVDDGVTFEFEQAETGYRIIRMEKREVAP